MAPAFRTYSVGFISCSGAAQSSLAGQVFILWHTGRDCELYVHGLSQLKYFQKDTLALGLFDLIFGHIQQEIDKYTQAVFAEVVKPDPEPLLVGIWVVFDKLFYRCDEMINFISRRSVADVQNCPYGPEFPHRHIIDGAIHQMVTGNRNQGIVEGTYAGTAKPDAFNEPLYIVNLYPVTNTERFFEHDQQ